jgi:NADPH2:quinone reductase
MRAIRFHRFGGPEVLTQEEVPAPAPAPFEVRVAVRAFGLNFADTERRRGLYLSTHPLPTITGLEGAGVVEALGEGVADLALGQRVSFHHPGAAAELVCVPRAQVFPLPDALDFTRGAAWPIAGLSAWHLLHTAARVRSGEWVGVEAAAGGVGLLATQLAQRAGARVVGFVSTAAKADRVRALGATALLRGPTLASLVTELTGGHGLDVLLDSVGARAAGGLELLAPFGRWVHFGDASGAAPAIDPALLYEKSVSVSAWWLRTPHPPSERQLAVQALLTGLVDGSLVQTVETTHGLEALRAAHAALERGTTSGKVVGTLG